MSKYSGQHKVRHSSLFLFYILLCGYRLIETIFWCMKRGNILMSYMEHHITVMTSWYCTKDDALTHVEGLEIGHQ